MSQTAERVMPQAPEAEEAILGACLVADQAADRVTDLCQPAWFYRETHQEIFKAVRALRAAGAPADVIAVMDWLESAGKLEAAGGRARLQELAALVPTVSNVVHYVGIVRDCWIKRQVLRRSVAVAELAANGHEAQEAVAALELAALDVAHTADEGRPQSVWTGPDAAADLRARLANPVDEDETGVAAPFSFLMPFQPGRLYVLGGYAKDGKTAVALHAFRVAAEAGARCGFVTLEMTRRDLRDRLVAMFGVPYLQVRTGKVTPKYQAALEHGLRFLDSRDVAIVDDARTPEAISRVQRTRGFDFLVVDHLHRLRVESERASELRVELERSLAALTDLTISAEVPVLLLAQLHRPAGRDDFPKPTMQSFRETGKIEQEASALWCVWRHRENGKRTPRADLVVLADRYGPEVEETLHFEGERVRFTVEEPER